MKAPVKVLLVEDNPGDVRLIRVVLGENADAPFEVIWTDRLSKAEEMVVSDNPDAVLLDLSLPDSQGLPTVINIVAKVPGVPIIVLTGLDDEAVAVRALQEGAQDYIVKNQLDGNLLSRTIRYAIQRKETEEALRANEQRFRALVEIGEDEIVVLDAQLKPIYLSPSVLRTMDYDPDQPEAWKNPFGFIHSDDQATATKIQEQLLQQPRESLFFQLRLRRQDGSWRWVEGLATNLLQDPSVGGLVYNFRNITERKLRERELEATAHLNTAARAARTLDELLPGLLHEMMSVFRGAAGSIWLYDPASEKIRMAHQQGWGDAAPVPLKRGEGIVGSVLETGKAYLAQSLKTDPNLHESARQHVAPDQSGAYVPIRAADQVIGVLTINTSPPTEFSESDLQFAERLAEIAGNAIYRTRLHEQTERRLQNIAALRAIDKAISSSFDIQFILGVVLEQVTKRLEVDAAAVLLLDPYLHRLEYGAGRGFRSEVSRVFSFSLGQGDAGRAALEHRTIAFSNLSESYGSFVYAEALQKEDFKAYFSVPLIVKGKVNGLLEIFHRQPLSTDSEWVDFLETLAGQAAIALDGAALFNDLQRSNLELALAYDATIEGWSHALDLRDKETEGHTQRVTEMTMELARRMKLSKAELTHVRRGALLHDIGKMGIPDAILLKPGSLTDEEWEVMRMHPTYAYEMLSSISYLRPALEIPYYHHEKWDGSGYPNKLKGDEIPLAARIFMVADVYDALTSDRPYRQAWPKKKVLDYIKAESGTHFDPAVARVFLEMIQEKV